MVFATHLSFAIYIFMSKSLFTMYLNKSKAWLDLLFRKDFVTLSDTLQKYIYFEVMF